MGRHKRRRSKLQMSAREERRILHWLRNRGDMSLREIAKRFGRSTGTLQFIASKADLRDEDFERDCEILDRLIRESQPSDFEPIR